MELNKIFALFLIFFSLSTLFYMTYQQGYKKGVWDVCNKHGSVPFKMQEGNFNYYTCDDIIVEKKTIRNKDLLIGHWFPEDYFKNINITNLP